MSENNIYFDEKNINKHNSYRNKKLFNIDYIDVTKTLVFKKELYAKKRSFKYFIEYNDNDDIGQLCTKLPQMIGYVKCFDSNKTISFNVTNKKTIEK